jgi:hypothetical protein
MRRREGRCRRGLRFLFWYICFVDDTIEGANVSEIGSPDFFPRDSDRGEE